MELGKGKGKGRDTEKGRVGGCYAMARGSGGRIRRTPPVLGSASLLRGEVVLPS